MWEDKKVEREIEDEFTYAIIVTRSFYESDGRGDSYSTEYTALQDFKDRNAFLKWIEDNEKRAYKEKYVPIKYKKLKVETKIVVTAE